MTPIVHNLSALSDILLFSDAKQLSHTEAVTYLETNGRTIHNGSYSVFFNSAHADFYQAYKLYSDYTNSFMYEIVSTADGKYEPFSNAVANDQTSTIAVPSRLQYTATREHPSPLLETQQQIFLTS